MNTKLSFKKLVFVGLLVLALAPVAAPLTVHAQTTGSQSQAGSFVGNLQDITVGDCLPWNFGCHLQNFTNWLVRWVMVLIFSIVSLVTTFFAAAIELLITFSRDILGTGIVHEGFKVTLAIANLGFVLAIIIIAFATILRFDNYEMKKTLRNLIIAAILINFSLAIVGIFLDFTNVLGYFFIDAANPHLSGTFEFSKEMAASLNVQKLIEIKPLNGSIPQGLFHDVASMVLDNGANVISLFLTLAFSLLIMLTFGALTFMLIVRYVYISILVILMPLVWLFWTIPSLSHLWSKWWNKFIQQAFFLPAVTFFLYLAMLSSRTIDQKIDSFTLQQIQTPDSAAAAVEGSLLQKDAAANFMAMFVKLGLFAGALMAGHAIGIAGAGATLDAAKSAGKSFLGYKKGGMKELGSKVGGAARKAVARVPVLRSYAGVFAPGVRKETAKIKGGQSAALMGIATKGSETGAYKYVADYRAGNRNLDDIRRTANKNLLKTVRPAERRNVNEARLAMAMIEKEGIEYSPSGIPVSEISLPRSESRRNQKTFAKHERRLTRGAKIKKKEEEEEHEEKIEHFMEKHGSHGGEKHGKSENIFEGGGGGGEGGGEHGGGH